MVELNRDPVNRSADSLFTYFHSIILYILSWVRLLFEELGQRITKVELALDRRVDETDSVVSLLDSTVKKQEAKFATALQALAASAPTPSGSSTSGSSSQSSTSRTSSGKRSTSSNAATQGSHGRFIKCSKCHARGHSADECRSTNPAAIRRRVSQNKKSRGSQRFDATALTPTNLSLLPAVPMAAPMYAPPTTYAPAPAPTVVAEAAELRRRIAQSNRDRRRNRARASTPTPSSK